MGTMTIALTAQQIEQIAEKAAQKALMGFLTSSDTMSERKVLDLLKKKGRPHSLLNRLKDTGAITGKRAGSASNSKIVYNTSEVMRVIETL